jgi:Flp pilus assembly protein TadG
MMSGRASAVRRFSRRFGCSHREGGGAAVACAAAAPLVLLALAVGADYASVSRFKTRVQLAADAGSLAAAEALARHPGPAGGGDAGALATHAAAAVFISRAPRGAVGAPTVAAQSRAAVVTATVAYAGVAPSNFGAALGYDAISVNASAVSPVRPADSRLTAAR